MRLSKHFNTPGEPHGLTFSCFRNRKFLNYQRPRLYLADAVERAKSIHKFHVWAYVIMPDHVHLLIFPLSDSYNISEILKSIKQPVARKTIQYLRVKNPEILKLMKCNDRNRPYRFWQNGGGYDRNIKSEDELAKYVRYVHENPVKQGLVENQEQWYWSSARQWLSGMDGPIHVDREFFPVLG